MVFSIFETYLLEKYRQKRKKKKREKPEFNETLENYLVD